MIQSLELINFLQKGTKQLHKNGDSYDRLRCSVREIIVIILSMHLFPIFTYVHCTLREEKKGGKDEPNSGVQRCSALFGSHAKCIHFTGIYSMLSIKDWMGGTQ